VGRAREPRSSDCKGARYQFFSMICSELSPAPKATVMLRSYVAIFALTLVSATVKEATAQQSSVPVASPLNSESFNTGGIAAVQSVMRVICPQQDSQGTGFLHKSGMVITAAHVIKDCVAPKLLLPSNTVVESTIEGSDLDFDFAILRPASKITAAALPITDRDTLNIGTQLSTWGFPGGYFGLKPMLSIGVLSGQDAIKSDSGKLVAQYVVNAAFNSGNSGGPLLQVETGEVVGIVVSKLAPISDTTMAALKAIQENQSGVIYNATRPDGTSVQLVEGQVIAMVLEDLRKQVQLVIGRAAMSGDLKNFLRYHGINP
jgi:S1-C subfamily serine protease